LAGEIEGYDLEKRFLCKDGHVIHTHLAVQCLRNPDRSVDYIVALILDVTEHKQAEEKLHESEEKFRSLLDSQESNIMMYDFDGVHHYVNQGALATMTNGTSQDIIGKRLHDLYPAHIADWQLEQIRQVFTTGKGFSGDFRTGSKSQASWWHLNLQPIRNLSGQVMQVMVNSLDITERKHAEAALKNSEIFINGVLNSLTAQIAVLDEEGVIISVNESWKNFAVSNGCPDPACYLGFNYLTVCETAVRAGDQSAEDILGGMRAVLAGSQAQFIQEYPCDAPEIPRWFTVTVLPQKQPSKGLIIVHQDISERKLAEQALQESEKRNATILRLSPIVIGVSTLAEGYYTDLNDAFEHVMGYSRAEAIGRNSFDLNIWVDDDTRSNIIHEIQVHGRIENMEVRLRRKSGEIFPALIFITPITLHDTACLLTMMMDITERKCAEEQLRETRDTLQAIIYSSPLTILTFDSDDRITMWNPAAESMFGWSEKQTLGQIDPTVPENKLREAEALRNATLSGMSFSNMDTVRMKNDGEQFHVSLSVAPLRGQENEVIGRLHIITDITERKRLQEELRQQATTDELTKISNRRHFIELASSEIKRAIRLKRPPAFALIDIDHFKQINDTYGHTTGDLALIEFTNICQRQIREIDVFARFGGDEFVLLFPETNKEQAYEIVERIRLALMKNPVDLDGQQVAITLSCGIASLGDEQISLDTLLNRADQALYRAKETGRNRVIIDRQ
jgi:diguanylate cyclase (GGDEF)-like protein/PAS domain S-box-containing protein